MRIALSELFRLVDLQAAFDRGSSADPAPSRFRVFATNGSMSASAVNVYSTAHSSTTVAPSGAAVPFAAGQPQGFLDCNEIGIPGDVPISQGWPHVLLVPDGHIDGVAVPFPFSFSGLPVSGGAQPALAPIVPAPPPAPPTTFTPSGWVDAELGV